jgi:hypothetical protein
MKAYLRSKRKDQIIETEDEPKHSFNMKLQEELTKAAQIDQEKKRVYMLKQQRKAPPKMNHFKLSEQLNQIDLNNDEEKSKMIEQLMELSINTKQTKDVNESNLFSGNKSGVRL